MHVNSIKKTTGLKKKKLALLEYIQYPTIPHPPNSVAIKSIECYDGGVTRTLHFRCFDELSERG